MLDSLERMPREFKRVSILVGAILLALLPLVELVDHWESFGADPEFVSVCTVLGIAFAMCLLVRAAVLRVVKYFRVVFLLPFQSSSFLHSAAVIIQTVFPRIRDPLRL